MKTVDFLTSAWSWLTSWVTRGYLRQTEDESAQEGVEVLLLDLVRLVVFALRQKVAQDLDEERDGGTVDGLQLDDQLAEQLALEGKQQQQSETVVQEPEVLVTQAPTSDFFSNSPRMPSTKKA